MLRKGGQLCPCRLLVAPLLLLGRVGLPCKGEGWCCARQGRQLAGSAQPPAAGSVVTLTSTRRAGFFAIWQVREAGEAGPTDADEPDLSLKAGGLVEAPDDGQIKTVGLGGNGMPHGAGRTCVGVGTARGLLC